jgi:phosphotransferase system HPr-like phosphotransfer protein
MPKTTTRQPALTPAAGTPTVCDKADSLFRSAAECCRQHRRYSKLVEMGTDENEQRAALRLVVASDEQLAEAAENYESSCLNVNGERHDEWFRKANNLWAACREYARRHTLSNRASGEFRAHSVTKLAALGVEYELEASALLAMQHAVDAYRKLRPQADWNAPAR